MRPRSVDGWLNECAEAAERGADLVAYELVVDGEMVGYVAAKNEHHAANIVIKHHGAVECSTRRES